MAEAESLNFDDETSIAIAKVYLMEGDDKYRNKQPHNAIHFYSEGLQVNWRDDQLNAELYSKRAEASFFLGYYQETLDDASVAVALDPTLIKAIELGASACVQLQLQAEAIQWCQKGLSVSFV